MTAQENITPETARPVTDSAPKGRRKNLAFDPLFTKELMLERETAADFNVHRRVMLSTLTCSSQELMKSGNGHAVLDVVEIIQQYQEHLEVMREFSETAINRLLTVAQAMVETPE